MHEDLSFCRTSRQLLAGHSQEYIVHLALGYLIIPEQRRVLDAAIAELPEDMRSAVVLRDVQGFSYDEISAMLEVNVGTIKSRISRGREKLRQILQENSELFN